LEDFTFFSCLSSCAEQQQRFFYQLSNALRSLRTGLAYSEDECVVICLENMGVSFLQAGNKSAWECYANAHFRDAASLFLMFYRRKKNFIARFYFPFFKNLFSVPLEL